MNNKNSYSRACEIRGAVEGTINEAVLHDIAIFKEFFDYDNESPDTTRQLLEALTKIDKETLVHLTAIILALSKK